MITADIIADSINPAGIRLITWKLTYPRIIHAEFMTHRVFSRNAASSRAIPTAKWIEAIRADPAMPVEWGMNQKGMQAGEKLDWEDQQNAEAIWLEARDAACAFAERMAYARVHKQIVNRMIEPWMHMTVIASATDYKGFFAQRAHPAAQPEFQALAYKMKELYDSHTPRPLRQREWHLPGISLDEHDGFWAGDKYVYEGTMDLETAKKVSTSRMAAVSYLRHEDQRPLDKWMEVWERLVGSDVLHLSPLEHPAMAAGHNARLSNFRGFHQLRASYDPYAEV